MHQFTNKIYIKNKHIKSASSECSNVVMSPSSKENNHRHPNKLVGMGKLPEINKRSAYSYSKLKSNLTFQ